MLGTLVEGVYPLSIYDQRMYSVAGYSSSELLLNRTLFARNIILSVSVTSGGPIDVVFQEIRGKFQIIRNNVSGFNYQGRLLFRGIYQLVIYNYNNTLTNLRLSLTQHGPDNQQLAVGVTLFGFGFCIFVILFIWDEWSSSEFDKNQRSVKNDRQPINDEDD